MLVRNKKIIRPFVLLQVIVLLLGGLFMFPRFKLESHAATYDGIEDGAVYKIQNVATGYFLAVSGGSKLQALL